MGRFSMVTKILSYFRISLLGIRALLRHNPFTNKALPVHHMPPNTSTSVERALQINLFMQNEPKSQKSQVSLNALLTSNYGNWTLGECGKNEPKRTQNEPKPQNAKIKLTPYQKTTYTSFRCFALFKNEPKRTQSKPKTNPTSIILGLMCSSSVFCLSLPLTISFRAIIYGFYGIQLPFSVAGGQPHILKAFEHGRIKLY